MTVKCECDREFRHESLQDVETVLAYLDAVREGIRSGALTLSASGETMELNPQGLVRCDVQAKCKSGRCKLSLKFSWKDLGSETESEPLVIETGEAAANQAGKNE